MNTKSSLSGLCTKFACLFALILIINASSAQTYVTGGIYANTTWTTIGSPYILTDTVVVFANITVTIQPGVIVKFNNNAYMEVLGNLYASGTANDSIIFTSNSITPHPGIYNGILFSGDSGSFRYCKFSYATSAITYGGFGDDFPFSHCLFVSNETGVTAPDYNCAFDTCTFKYDTIGFNPGLVFGYVNSCEFRYNSTAITGISGNIDWVTNSVFCNNKTGMEGVISNYSGITYCVFDSNSYVGIEMCSNDSIRHCTIKYNGTGMLIEDQYVAYNNISDNHIGIISNNGSTIEMNTISNNYIGIETNDDIIHCNSICNNSHYNIIAEMANNEIADYNYWCLPDSAHIQVTIYDAYQDINYGFVFFTPFDTVPCTYITGGVQDLATTSEDVKLYPNPNNGNFTLSVTNNELGIANIKIYNSLGQMVYKSSITQKASQICLNNATTGVYLYRIISEKGNLIGTGKFVVE